MADRCLAPVFERNNLFVCIILAIIYAAAILAIIIGTLFLCLFFPACRCIIRQYQFRITNCMKGNSDPAIPI